MDLHEHTTSTSKLVAVTSALICTSLEESDSEDEADERKKRGKFTARNREDMLFNLFLRSMVPIM